VPYKNPEDRRARDRAYYLANKEKKKAQNRVYYLANKEAFRANAVISEAKLIAEYRALKSKPCVDCGIEYPYYVMQYDHRDDTDKVDNVSWLLRMHQARAMRVEIAKCDVVCANCHAVRTWKRHHEQSYDNGSSGSMNRTSQTKRRRERGGHG
jgi:hypothetical protein